MASIYTRAARYCASRIHMALSNLGVTNRRERKGIIRNLIINEKTPRSRWASLRVILNHLTRTS